MKSGLETVGQLMEPAIEPPERATLAQVEQQLAQDEALFVRVGQGWEAVVARLALGQPMSRRLIDLPTLPVEPLAPDTDVLQALPLIERTPLPCSPVVAGGRLVGRLSHERLRAVLRDTGHDDLVAELALTREVTAAIAHDLSNVLMIASSASDLVLRRAPKDCGSGLRESLTQAIQLVERLRALHRTPHGTPVRVNLLESAKRMRPVLEALIRGVARLDLDGEAAVATCPATLVDRTCLNLVINARDALDDGGTIQIRTGRGPQGFVWFSVRDDGAGIGPDVLPRLFDRGFSTKAGEHRGLGLHTLRRLVQRAGGDVLVESAVGEGTTFTVRLPEAI